MRISLLKRLLFAVPMASVLAQATALQMNVVYECPPGDGDRSAQRLFVKACVY
jgi:hypothetical protein